MNNLVIEATKRTPGINFDFDNHVLSFTGESYPEDASVFFGEIISALNTYTTSTTSTTINVNFDLIYFNSSSAKALMRIFDMLDASANNNDILIKWFYEEDDDNMAELGEEFGEDLVNAKFELVIK